MALGYSRTVDTDFYEYHRDDFLPINISVLDSDQEGVPFRPGSLVSDQLSSQGTGSPANKTCCHKIFTEVVASRAHLHLLKELL